MFVFLVLDFLVGFFQRLADFAADLLRALADQFPVQMILGFCNHDTLTGDQLRGFRGSRANASSIAATNEPPSL